MTKDFARTAGGGLRLARSVIVGSSLVAAGLAPVATSATEARVSDPVDLATAASYAVLADDAVTNTGSSVIDGDVGVHPGTEVSGFPPGVVNGERNVGDAAAERAQADLTDAYQDAVGRDARATIGPGLGGQTLTPGVYRVAEDADLDGTLTLDAQGDATAVFILQVGSDLDAAENSTVRVVNTPGPACNVFWTVGDSADLNTNTSFTGRIMAVRDIRLETAARVEQGGALSRDGAVTLDTNAVSRSDCAAATAPASPTTPAPVTPGTTPPETRAPAPTPPEVTESPTAPPTERDRDRRPTAPPGRPDRDEQPGRDERPDRPDRDEQPGRPDREGPPGQSDRDEQPGRPDRDGPPGQSGRDEQPGRPDRGPGND
ncbi:ice-binding family protein [Micromonospora sp. BQ11]|uniref:ice-binding family protein n=1 Tax=Micromonospora sp. BQ11 TaxID=3452212 RepID=UPI003F8C4CCD